MLFYVSLPTRFSSPKTTGLISLVVTVLMYIFVSRCVYWWEDENGLIVGKRLKLKRGPKRFPGYRYLDPVVLSSGPNSKGSISRLQILFFSFLVFFLLLNIFLETGQLSDVSETILYLMGISGIGAGLAKVTEVGKERLSFENWAWLIDRKWLPQNGPAATNVASWKDIVTSADGVDVYHVQMLVFSLVVGMSLFKNGVTATDLSAFAVPSSMLMLLGLSQAIYVGGKVVAAPAIGDLDEALTELRKRESAYCKASLQPAAAAGPAAQSELINQYVSRPTFMRRI
jgi:hypothetical protein